MSQDDSSINEDKKIRTGRSLGRSNSFDIRNMFSSKIKNDQADQSTEFKSPPNRKLNRNLSQPESSKFSTLRKSLLNHTQSMKKTTADFFGVNKEDEDEAYQLWLEKRKRFYGVKEKKATGLLVDSDTNDSRHLHQNRLAGGDTQMHDESQPTSNFALLSSFERPSVLKMAVKGMKKISERGQIKKRSTNVVGDEQADISLETIRTQSEPLELKVRKFSPTDDITAESPILQQFDYSGKQEIIPTSEFLPDDLLFSPTIPSSHTKTWTIVDRYGRRRIDSRLIESIYDNSDRRQFGMGIIGQLLNRKFRSNLTSEQKEHINSIYDSRPYFTYWIISVQSIIMILALLTYGFGPIGVQKVEIREPVLVNSLSIQEVSYFEPNNIWIGPRAADLIHLGAKFTPCMRKDKLIFDQITKEREDEKNTACCIRTDKSGCIQTKRDRCSRLLSTWQKWTANDSVTYVKDNRVAMRTSGSVCGQDPRYCLEPKSWFPNVWPDDITKWPICKEKKISKNSIANQDAHMSCDMIGRPCCIGIHGECQITTRDYCNFVRGFFHEEATLCSQVSCMSDVCGMIQIKRDDNLFQIYRLFTSLFLHAGFIHIVISFTFQLLIVKDFEKLIGSTRISLIYLLSGIGGNLASAIFVPYRAEVGPGGSQFGILAGLIAEQIHSWDLVEQPGLQLMKLIGIAFALFAYGLFPWIDNYAHISGFVIGFLLSLALLPFLTFTKRVKRKRKIAIIFFCFLTVFIIFVVLLLFLYKFPIYDCKWCSYLNCIPLTADWCSDHQISIQRKDILWIF